MNSTRRRQLSALAGAAETEAGFQAAVIDLARLRGWLVHHCRPARTGAGWATPITGDPGFPDLVLARPPRLIFAELKSTKGRVSRDQERWVMRLDQCDGVEMHVLRPSDWAAVEDLLR